MLTARFVLFNIISWVTVVFWTMGVLLAWPFGHKYSYAVAANWTKLIAWLVRNICGLKYRVIGMENFPKETCVLFIKHSSAFETYMQLVLFPRNCWVLKRELLWVPFFGWTLVPLKAIAIDRSKGGAAVAQVIEQGKARLAAGINVSVFPEGTRVPAGQTKRFGKSGTLLAQAAGCKIVPVAHNAGYHWGRRGLAIKPGTVSFVVGAPVDPAGRDAGEVNAEIQNWIEQTITEIVKDEV